MAKKTKQRRSAEPTGDRKIFRMFRDKSKATIKPVASIADLAGLWDREFGVYRVVVVKVTGRAGSLLQFEIVVNPAGDTDETTHEVDLDDGANVWGDLPSTAQLVDPNSKAVFGYLLLNENWLYENTSGGVTQLDGPGDPPKVPRVASL